jgi:DNA-binding LacI/PurR family transcriptional regulator
MPINYEKLIDALDAASEMLDIAQAATESDYDRGRTVFAMRAVREAIRDVTRDRCAVYEEALNAAGLSCLVATSWFTKRSRSCDGVAMLHDVCTRQVNPLSIAEAVGRLAIGEVPEGARPMSDASEILHALRRRANPRR